MTLEEFNKAAEIRKNIEELIKTKNSLTSRVERFNDYLSFMDGRVPPVTWNGKVYKKAEIRFNMDEHPLNIDTRDMFDLVEENKKEFVDFLKKCQNGYLKKIKEIEANINKLEEEFVILGTREVAA